jgi:multiple sugar transport system permease protein
MTMRLDDPRLGPKTRSEEALGTLLFLPALAVIVLLFVLPVAYEVVISLYRSRVYEPADAFVGLQNYRWLFSGGDLPRALANTLVWTVGSVLGQAVVGIFLAVVLMQDLPGRTLIRTLLLCTWIMPGVVGGIIWRWMFDPIVGVLNAALAAAGCPEQDFLGRSATALACCILANIWKGVPFWLLMVSARLQAVPADLYDAAAVDGAGWLHRFRHITVPQIRGIVTICGLLAFIWTFNSFDMIYALTRGGPDIATTTVPMLIYEVGMHNGHHGEAAASSIILLAIMAVVIGLFMRRSLARTEET